MGDAALPLLQVEWPVPQSVQALATTRQGGVSCGPFASLNLGLNSGDAPDNVQQNRLLLRRHLPSEPFWLQQVHGTDWVYAPLRHQHVANTAAVQADASWTDQAGQVLAILSADCLPVLLCAEDGAWVAAIHAGWRGLAAGIIPRLMQALPNRGKHALAWLGPAISARHYQVGAEMRNAFIQQDIALASAFISQKKSQESRAQGPRWLADLNAIARHQLNQAEVAGIYGGEYCTYAQTERFFSYRRDTRTGRQACLIALKG